MMVGFDPREKQLSSWEHAASGAASGFITRGLTQPIDVLKIRFQLQLEPIRRSSLTSKYRGLYHSVKTMVAEETVRSLWKGHVPAQALSIIYASVQFGTFERLTKLSSEYIPHSGSDASSSAPSSTAPLLGHFICGGIAAATAVTVSHPVDVIRTRLSGQGEPKVYRSLAHAVTVMWTREGPTSFFRGLSANMMMCVPQAAIQFGLYSACCRTHASVFNGTAGDQSGLRSSWACGALSGVVAKLAVYPFDVAKKRLQVIGFEEARRPFGATAHYSGLVHCITTVARREGILGLYKGTAWALVKAGVTTGLYFATYEAFCDTLRRLLH